MKKLAAILASILVVTNMAGCMGRNAVSKSIQDWNLDTADSRWGREGLFILTFPVAWVSGFIDLFFVNSMEFWSGKNPVNKKGALVDVKVATLEKMGIHNVASAQSRYFENEVLMYVTYTDGTKEVFHATKNDDLYSFYRGKELVIQVKESQLKDLQASIKARMDTYAQLTGSSATL